MSRQREQRVSQFFVQLLDDLPERMAITMLESCQAEAPVHLFEPETASARRPGHHELSWPIIFLLGSYHRKHLFLRRTPPPLSSVSRSLSRWEQKARWRLYFNAMPSPLGEPSVSKWQFLKLKSRNTPCCLAKTNDSVNLFFQQVRDGVFNLCRKSVEAWPRQGRNMWTQPEVATIALKLIEQSPFEVHPTDKDGGYAVVRKDLIGEVVKNDILTCIR